MANSYCTTTQFFAFYDERMVAELSNDLSGTTADTTKLQLLLDTAAGELESYLAGRWALPLASVPAVLTRWVAVKAASMLWGRRNARPEGLNADEEWAAKWMDDLVSHRAELPNIGRQHEPTLVASDTVDGSSRFDNIPFFSPPPRNTDPSHGESWTGDI